MDQQHLDALRHSCAHLLAKAVKTLYPGAHNAIGPSIENGFYQDFDMGDYKITEADLPKIEAKMRAILPNWKKFSFDEVTAAEARKLFKDNPYKLELIEEFTAGGKKITTNNPGDFLDLCKMEHAENPGKELKNFKLLSIAGAYWRGNEKNKMLTRIYGTCFPGKKELEQHLIMLEEAKKRDHRKLGKEMELFTFSDLVGPGLPLWLPKGAAMIEELERLAKQEEFKAGYMRVRTPHLSKEKLYEMSGHLPYYKASMYPPMELEGEDRYYVKPMNCPQHHLCFMASKKSYRDLPLRLAEYGTCYRYEDSGALFGLMRVRSLQMNDSHIYCTEDQLEDEFISVTKLYLKYFDLFGIKKYIMRFSLHDPSGLGKKYVDEPALWKKTEEMVRRIMNKAKVNFEEIKDEAAFYGPKIDIQIWSAIGREFTLATNQVDFAQPRRMGLTYIDDKGHEQFPLVIHRAPLGTHERFIGFLIEHFGGAFPTWLAPVQVALIPIASAHEEYARQLKEKLAAVRGRVELMNAEETLGKRIRSAEIQKIPYILVVGDREAQSGGVTVRSHYAKKQETMGFEAFLQAFFEEVRSRRLPAYV